MRSNPAGNCIPFAILTVSYNIMGIMLLRIKISKTLAYKVYHFSHKKATAKRPFGTLTKRPDLLRPKPVSMIYFIIQIN